MGTSPIEVVFAWLAAVNAGDVDAVLRASAPDIAIHGPRGTSHGHDVLRMWVTHAGAQFTTSAAYAAREAVVIAQHGVWRDPANGAPRGEADVATRFRVVEGRIVELQRYDTLALALQDAGLSEADLQPRVAAV